MTPVNSPTPVPHEYAGLHVSGEATYTDDIPEHAGTLFCSLGLSQKAHAKIASMDLGAVRAGLVKHSAEDMRT